MFNKLLNYIFPKKEDSFSTLVQRLGELIQLYPKRFRVRRSYSIGKATLIDKQTKEEWAFQYDCVCDYPRGIIDYTRIESYPVYVTQEEAQFIADLIDKNNRCRKKKILDRKERKHKLELDRLSKIYCS